MKNHWTRRTILLFSFLLLLACQAPNEPGLSFPVPTSTITVTQIPTATPFPPLTATASQILTATTTQTTTPTASPTPTSTLTATPSDTSSPSLTPTVTPSVRRVIIISIDGLRPDAILPAPMTNLVTLMQGGAFSLGAQTVFPSITLPAHASMLGGVCPSKHGVFWNEYEPERGYAQGTDVFDLAHAAGLETTMYVGSEKMRHITEPPSLDRFIHIEDTDSVLMGSLIANFPQDFGVLFIHLLATDIAGHEAGWLSPYQIGVIREADGALGILLEELDARNLRGETLIIVTSDHGGSGSAHGSNAREDMTIPWIVAGPGVQPKTLTTLVHTMDTAATAAFALGLPIPAEWDGVPVYEAFGLPAERQSVQCE